MSGFSPKQEEAITHGDGPALVIAGPGSGKTTVLTNRIKYLIEERNIPPEQILTITFSKAASIEMSDRFLNLCEDTFYPVTFGTFHSIFFHIIHREYKYNTGDIITLRQKREYMKTAVAKAGIDKEAETEFIDSLLKSVAFYKNCNENVRINSDTNISEEDFLKVYRIYRDIQISAHKIDFEDMLLMVRNLFKKHEEVLARYREKFRYILVDEYQDINEIQFDIVRMLAAPANNIFAVGDDDQSIYGFRGSRSELMLGFRDVYPDAKLIELTVNYRCADSIIAAAGKVIAQNKQRFDKRIEGSGRSKGKVIISDFISREKEDEYLVGILKETVDKGNAGDCAVFLRTNREASRYAELMHAYDIPCDMKEAMYDPYKSYAYKDMYHYLCLAKIVRDGLKNHEMTGPGIKKFATAGMENVSRIKLPVAHLFPIMNKPVRYLNRRNILCDEISIDGLKDIYCDKPYMDKVLDTFAYQLAIISGMDLYSGINYIRKGMGYDDHIMENAVSDKESYDEYAETADWIQESSKRYATIEEFNRFAVGYEEMMKNEQSSMAENDKAEATNMVHIMTYHASKGLEFNMVILPHLNEGCVPHKRSAGPSATEEERRMLYVAMTRAKNNLYMTYVSGKNDRKCMPSRFLTPLLGLNYRKN